MYELYDKYRGTRRAAPALSIPDEAGRGSGAGAPLGCGYSTTNVIGVALWVLSDTGQRRSTS
jgi:hypothetical protein